MALRLKQGNGVWPQGGFPFVDSRTGKVFDAMSADLTLQAKNIIAHRKANPRLYPPSESHFLFMDAVKQEVMDYLCAKRPQLCKDADMSRVAAPVLPKNFVAQSAPTGKTCFKCKGTEFDPIYCKSCAGFKVRGWLCRNCKTPNPK